MVAAEAPWGALRRRCGHRVAFAGEHRENDVGHCARGRPLRPDGVGTEDVDHVVLAAERDGGAPVHGQRRRPDEFRQTDRSDYRERTISADGQADKEASTASAERDSAFAGTAKRGMTGAASTSS